MKLLTRKAPVREGTGSRTPVRRALRNTGPSQAVRRTVLGRDGYRCVRCGCSVLEIPFSIRFRRPGGSPTPENLITLCGTRSLLCSGYVDEHSAESHAAGWRVPGTEDPAAVPVLLAAQDEPAIALWLTRNGRYSTEPAQVRP